MTSMGCPSSSMSRLVCATSNRTWPSIKPSVRHRCSPSSIRSGSEMANGSAKARRAVSKLTPCLRRFAAALTGSHSNQVFIQICYNSFAVQRNLGSRCHAAGKESCYAAAWLICLSRAPARQPPPGRNAGWAAAAGFPVIPTHENRAFPLSVTGTTGAAWRFRVARPSPSRSMLRIALWQCLAFSRRLGRVSAALRHHLGARPLPPSP